jgi:hypothetical protein
MQNTETTTYEAKRERAGVYVIDNIMACRNLFQLENTKPLIRNFCLLYHEQESTFNQWYINREWQLIWEKHNAQMAQLKATKAELLKGIADVTLSLSRFTLKQSTDKFLQKSK